MHEITYLSTVTKYFYFITCSTTFAENTRLKSLLPKSFDQIRQYIKPKDSVTSSFTTVSI